MKSQKNVLLVDGDIQTTNDFKEILEGYYQQNVDICNDLGQFTSFLKTKIYDIIVSECIFDKYGTMDSEYFKNELWNGRECEKFIISQAQAIQPNIPIVFCTDKILEDVYTEDILWTFAYVKKPALVSDIMKKISIIFSTKKPSDC